MKERLTLAGLHQLDAIAAVAIDEDLKEAVRDCVDRPVVKGDRKVTITVIVSPDADSDGVVRTVHTQLETKLNTPRRLGRKTHCEAKGNGAALFNPESPGDPHQRTIDEALPGAEDGDAAA